MFDKFNIINPIIKKDYNIENEIEKNFDSLVTKTEYNYNLLYSQLYKNNKSLNNSFQNILKKYSSYLIDYLNNNENIFTTINEFIKKLPENYKNIFKEILINDINSDNNYEKIYNFIINTNEKYKLTNNINIYININKFEEYYSDRIIQNLSKINKTKIIFKEYYNILDIINNNYKHYIDNNINKILLIISNKIINFIDSEENEILKIKLSYDYTNHIIINNDIYILNMSSDNNCYNKFLILFKKISKLYIDLLYSFYNNYFNDKFTENRFETFNKILYYCNETKYKNNNKIKELKEYYLKYIFLNLNKKNIHKYIYNFLNYINFSEELILIFENKLKNYLLKLKYEKILLIINSYNNFINKIKLEPNTYDFIKILQQILIIYNISPIKYDNSNKNNEYKKSLILKKDTFINKYDFDDIYKNENNIINKLIIEMKLNDIYISKENTIILVEINNNGILEDIKLNLNQYMILYSITSEIENDFEVLKKGYGLKNINFLVKNKYIFIDNNIIKKLIN
jgi:hypothetical protein